MENYLDEQSPRLDVGAQVRLFPHQQAIAHKILEMESRPSENTFIGVLNDPVGTGKSFPLLAAILHAKRVVGESSTLLVIPPNIHEQWLEYIARFSSELTVQSLMYYGDVTALYYDARALTSFDILITTSTFYSMITTTATQIDHWFHRVIIDEIDSMSFFTDCAVPAQSVWLVSASAEKTNSGVYVEHAKKNSIKCDPLFIRRSVNLPPPVVEHHHCVDKYVDLIQGIVPDMTPVYGFDYSMIRFDYLDNTRVKTSKELFSCVYKNLAVEHSSLTESLNKLQKDVKWNAGITSELTRKKTKRDLVAGKLKTLVGRCDRKICPLCGVVFPRWNSSAPAHDTLKKSETGCCYTVFCEGCIADWLGKDGEKGRCPTCNSDKCVLTPCAENPEPIMEKQGRDKISELLQILEKETSKENYRVLIFSNYTGTFNLLRPYLEKFKYSEIEGNQLSMTRAIKDYVSGERPILLVDSLNYGSGMNLEMTTALIILHKSERNEQLIGRAWRLGRKDKLFVHHLLYPGEK